MITSLKFHPQSKYVSFVEEISDIDGMHTVNSLPLDSHHILDTPMSHTDCFSSFSSFSASSSSLCINSIPLAPIASSDRVFSAYDNVSAVVMTADLMASHLEFIVSLHRLYKHLNILEMINSGTMGIFINESMVNKHQLYCHLLKEPLHISNINGSANSASLLTHFVYMNIIIGTYIFLINMLVMNLSPKDLILKLS